MAKHLITTLVLLLIGVAAGMFVRPAVDRLRGIEVAEAHDDHDHHDEHDDHDDHHDDEEEHHGDHDDGHEEEHEDHVALSEEAYQNLGLSLLTVELQNYTQHLRMPGEILESPGMSSQKVAAPVRGNITQLFAAPGATVREGEPLFELQILDKPLIDSQSRLLELTTKQEIVESELARVRPLASSGSVAGRRLIDLEYEAKQVEASLARVRQELLLGGLATEQVELIEQDRRLISKLIVRAPSSPGTRFVEELTEAQRQDPKVRLAAYSRDAPAIEDLTIQTLHVEPGQSVERGEAICSLAAHGLLSVCGHAFENEIDDVVQAAANQQPIAVEFGLEGNVRKKSDLTIRYAANHVEEDTQSFRFYIPLVNEVLQESTDPLGRRYRSWRYRVGQRVHILLPKSQLENQVVLPRAAVVREGPDAFVFRQHIHEEPSDDIDHANCEHGPLHEEDEHEHEEAFIEFEPVPVVVVKQDQQQVVLKSGGELKPGDQIASGSAYQLLLAFKAQTEGGGGHHHHHH